LAILCFAEALVFGWMWKRRGMLWVRQHAGQDPPYTFQDFLRDSDEAEGESRRRQAAQAMQRPNNNPFLIGLGDYPLEEVIVSVEP